MSEAQLYDDAVRLLAAWAPDCADQRVIGERFLDLLRAQPGCARADHPQAHLTASALVVRADRQRVLLCLHGRINRWAQLGGHCEPDDVSLAAAALREATEESGIAGLLVHPVPIDLDIHPVACRYGQVLHYDVRFAVLAPPEAVAVVSDESHALGWFELDKLPSPLASATERLVPAALRALN